MKSCANSKISDPAQVRALGVIDLETIQRFVNFHYSVTLDLYGSEISSNAANFYTSGLKGRFEETKLDRRSRAAQRSIHRPGSGKRTDRHQGRARL